MAPKYQMGADSLRTDILDGVYQKRMLLPTEQLLCQQFQVSRQTVRQALERDLAELAGYRERVVALRQAIQTALERMGQQAGEMEQQAEELFEATPQRNLTLFQ